MSARALIIVALTCAACGSKSSDKAPPASPAPVVEPVPADSLELGIAVVDEFRWVVPESALLELAVDAAAGSVEAELGAGGLTIASLPPGGPLHQLGFQAGDVITSFDGSPLTVGAALEDLYRRARSAGSADLELRRGTEKLERTYYIIADSSAAAALGDKGDTEVADAIATGVRRSQSSRFDIRYDIDPLVVAALAANPDLLAGLSARRRHTPQPSAVAQALGLTPHDTLQSLDENTVRSHRDLSNALAKLGQARSFSLSIVRVKTPLVLRYRVVDDLVMDAQLASALEKWKAAHDEAAPPQIDPDNPDEPAAAGVEKLDEDHYALDQDVMVGFATNRARSARFVPSIKNGQPNGVKIYAVRPRSLLAAAGFRNGDTIHSVDGAALESDDDLAAAFAAAAASTTIRIELTRRGQPVTLTLDVR